MSRAASSCFTWCALGAVVFIGCNKTDSAPPASVSATALVVQMPSVDVNAGAATALSSTEAVVSAAAPTTAPTAPSERLPAARDPKPAAVSSAVAAPRGPASVSPPLAASAAPPAAAQAPAIGAPCKATTFKFSSVADACKKGGVKQAKAMMKTLVNRAKANGQVVKCTSCHSDSKTYALKSNANADFKALLALPPG